MSTGPITQVADLFQQMGSSEPIQQESIEKNALVTSGAVVRSPLLNTFLSSVGNVTFDIPSFAQLTNDPARVGTDSVPAGYTGGVADPDPYKMEMDVETAVALRRNGSWATSDLAMDLSNIDDPVGKIVTLTAPWLTQVHQTSLIATVKGVFADNDASPSGTEHVQGDMTVDISALSGDAAKFSAEAIIDAQTTMLDHVDDLAYLLTHPLVYAKMRKNNLIDFIPDSEGKAIPTYQNSRVITDKRMPYTGSGVDTIFDTWLFGAGAFLMGSSVPRNSLKYERKEGAGNGAGADVIYLRDTYCFHPVGYKYVGTSPKGGPTDGSGSNNLANAGSWLRVLPNREQIKIARLKSKI